ncbi:Dbl homology domain-containing protein [Phascolomyces articulosus]|uniref:Dbl homology domain-containing protein n=1 Tax=Phascolomyces articulosus TaxID=60185 RepID=A0AAD5JQ42_9FUNG|nr:Dbl homology domain-containing protein [Phascolomyces articulosus]
MAVNSTSQNTKTNSPRTQSFEERQNDHRHSNRINSMTDNDVQHNEQGTSTFRQQTENYPNSNNNTMHNQEGNDYIFLKRGWSTYVPLETLQSTPKKEIVRQEAICELIYTEEDYSRDLNLLDELFAKPLRTAQCIDEDRRDIFCDIVFNNYLEILSIHQDLSRELRDYQNICRARSTGRFVDQVGNILLRHVYRFMSAYAEYSPHVALAEYIYKKEAANNMLFSNFLREKEKQPECRKLEFRHYLMLPLTRIQRYPLLLGSILRHTKEDHLDKHNLTLCLEEMRDVHKHVDALTKVERMVVRLYQISDSLEFKTEEYYADLRLGEPGRQLLFEGRMTRRRWNMGRPDVMEHYVFLFDHYLLITKSKRNGGYVIWKRPIPLELLRIRDDTADLALGSQQRSNQQQNNNNTDASAEALVESPSSYINPQLSSTSLSRSSSSTLILQHLSKHGGEYLLVAEDAHRCLEWKQMISKAKLALGQTHPEHKTFEFRSLSDTDIKNKVFKNKNSLIVKLLKRLKKKN